MIQKWQKESAIFSDFLAFQAWSQLEPDFDSPQLTAAFQAAREDERGWDHATSSFCREAEPLGCEMSIA